MLEQFGFRPNYSTQHKFLRIVQFLSENHNKKLPASLIFLDVAKAFGKVWHEGLIYRLI